MTERQVVAAALAAALSAWWHPVVPWWIGAVLAVAAVSLRRPSLVIVAVAAIAASGASTAMAGLSSGPFGPARGVATVWSDPVHQAGGSSLELRLDGRHLLASASGALEGRLSMAETGDELLISGRIQPFGERSGWATSRHLSGRIELADARPVSSGSWPFRIANRVRRLLTAGIDSLDPDEQALFRGLVIGDDRDQSELMAFRFRASGLGHLLAVSGQNVAFVLVAAAPMLTRLRLRSRWAVTIAVLALFTLVTRWEPSVLRAVVMAGVAATASLMGRATSGVRIVSVAVAGLICLDPLLVSSFGFQLSVAATVGLLVLARPIARRIPGPRWLAEAVGVVLAAQIGTVPLLVLAGEPMSSSSIPANLLAVPIAGWVMVWGLTAGFVAGAGGGVIATLCHEPTRALLWWVNGVASVAARPVWPRASGWVAMWVGLGLAALLVLRGRRRRWGILPAAVVVAVVLWPSAGAARVVGTAVMAIEGSDGTQLVVIGGRARVRDVLDLAGEEGCPDLVIVTSGAARPTEIIHALRQVCGEVRVLAPNPVAVAGSRQLPEGPLGIGELKVRVSETDGRWSVTP